jgi:hypothetical protein
MSLRPQGGGNKSHIAPAGNVATPRNSDTLLPHQGMEIYKAA